MAAFDTSRYRQLFIDEVRRHLATIDTRLAAPSIDSAAWEIFRSFHTVKGMAATMGVPAMTETAGVLEEICKRVTDGDMRGERPTADLLTEGVALLDRQLRIWEEGGTPEADPELLQRVRDFSPAVVGFSLIEENPPEESPIDLGPPRVSELAMAAMAELLAAAAHLRQLAADSPATRAEVDRIEAATRQLYDEIISLRRVPFGAISMPLRHRVRTAAESRGLKVSLAVHGEDVLVDQPVLAALLPAIIHVLTNAAVHGIEPTAVRRERNKPPYGRLLLSAERLGNDLALRIEDDGNGFDTQRLRRAAGVTEGDAVSHAFRLGVSTAEVVDTYAGKGLGLPEVKQVVDRLGGTLSVHTIAGRGTSFRIRVPIQSDMERLVLVEAGDLLLALPAGTEPAGVDAEAPALLGLAVTGDVVVTTRAGTRVRVDRVVESTQALVSPPPFPLNRMNGVRGATIAPDGRVVCVIEL